MGGFFGTVRKTGCVNHLFYGVDYNSHMGTKRAGMATLDEGRFFRAIHNIQSSYFRTKFESELGSFSGNSGIGIISDTDAQPIIIQSHLGRFAIVTVARINNIREIEAELLAGGSHFSEHSAGSINPTELVGILISKGKTFAEGIENVYNKVKGSCSMLLLTDEGIIAARDRFGRTPIVIGKGEDGYAVSSESCAFFNLGYEIDSFVGPGEIVLITADGCRQLRKPGDRMQVCSFLWVYYGYPVCEYEGRNVDQVRNCCGVEMGRSDEIVPDTVSGIPDSGVGMGLGYAVGKGVPYKRCMVKYTPTWPRSFTPPNQQVRELVAKMKLIPNRSMLQDKSIVLCDDSIVRGTQLRDHVSEIYEYGVKEVHIRISCPPLIHPCTFLNFSDSNSPMELLTRRIIKGLEGDGNAKLKEYATTGSSEYNTLVEGIRRQMRVTSLKFSPIETLVKNIGLPKEKICTHCFDGSSYEE